jgi:hypothetical protein
MRHEHNSPPSLLDVIKETCPWFWKLKELIGERPNVNPVGIGNNASPIDDSVLGPSELDLTDDFTTNGDLTDDFPTNGDGPGDSATGDDPFKIESDGDSLDSDSAPTRKRKLVPDVTDVGLKKKTSAKAGTSMPAATPGATSSKKPKNVVEKFVEVAKAEEETTHKILDLKKERERGKAAATVASIQAKKDIQMQKAKLRANAKQLKMTQDHEFRMLQLRQSLGGQGSAVSYDVGGPGSLSAGTHMGGSDNFRVGLGYGTYGVGDLPFLPPPPGQSP